MNGITLKTPPHEGDHHIGNLSAPVIIVEYGDFECPHCAQAESILQKIRHEFSQNLCFIYRHFPVLKTHPNAGVAAVTAEAAGVQGKFWEMHHALFEHSSDLEGDKMLFLARELGLDMRLFLNDLEYGPLADKVHQQYVDGRENGINETPGLFLNGIHLHNMPSYEDLEQAVENILKEKQLYL